MGWKKAKIGDVLTRVKSPVNIENDIYYKRVTIKINHNGILPRDVVIGKEIGTKKQFIVKKGQFLVSKIDARYGAFGIVPVELDGAIITGNFWSYSFDQGLLDINWFNLLIKSESFYDICERSSSGITHRKYLDEKKFLNFEILIPSVEEQKQIAEKLKHSQERQKLLQQEIDNQKTNLKNLRKQILQDAVEGKLTKEWREKNPDIEPANELLKKIKQEKENLIVQKKIKKEKPLPPISESEIPFELPESWVWTRLGGIIRTSSGDFLASYQMHKDGEIPVYGGNGVNGFHDKYNVSGQKIVIGRVGAYCGSIHLTPEKAWVTDNSLVVSFSEADLNKKWLVFLLKVADLGKLSFNGSQPVISGTKIYSQTAPLPPLPEQLAIVSKLQNLMQKLDEAEKQIEKSLETNKLLTKAILAEAFKSEV